MRGFCGQLAIYCCLLASLLFVGCAAPDPQDQSNDHISTRRLWREGYGFNNPNAERIRNGLPPEDDSWLPSIVLKRDGLDLDWD